MPRSAGDPFQFAFSAPTNGSYSVLSSTNITAPVSSWSLDGSATNVSSDLYLFAEPATNSQRYYRLRSP